jgi:hypothetical protein
MKNANSSGIHPTLLIALFIVLAMLLGLTRDVMTFICVGYGVPPPPFSYRVPSFSVKFGPLEIQNERISRNGPETKE